jgi:hypothetical protein
MLTILFKTSIASAIPHVAFAREKLSSARRRETFAQPAVRDSMRTSRVAGGVDTAGVSGS